MFRQERTRGKTSQARLDPRQPCLKPRRRRPEARTEQADRAGQRNDLNSCNRAARGFGGFAARADLRQPPHPAGIGNNRVTARSLAGIVNGGRDGGNVGADRAARDMRAQRLRHARLERRGQYFRFELALDPFHFLPPRSAAILRRARNSIAFKLPSRRPNASAISRCEAPSAYASHNMARSRGLRRDMARVKSAFRSGAPPKSPDGTLSISLHGRLKGARIRRSEE